MNKAEKLVKRIIKENPDSDEINLINLVIANIIDANNTNWKIPPEYVNAMKAQFAVLNK